MSQLTTPNPQKSSQNPSPTTQKIPEQPPPPTSWSPGSPETPNPSPQFPHRLKPTNFSIGDWIMGKFTQKWKWYRQQYSQGQWEEQLKTENTGYQLEITNMSAPKMPRTIQEMIKDARVKKIISKLSKDDTSVFLSINRNLMVESDQELFRKKERTMALGYFFLAMSGLFLNFAITDLMPKFIQMQAYKKGPLRILAFFLPLYVGHELFFKGFSNENNQYFQNRYYQRIKKLAINQNFEQYFKDL